MVAKGQSGPPYFLPLNLSLFPRREASSGQAGWVRKQCSRGLLGGGWKERYLRLDKGRLLIYEQQGDAQCEETVDLGKYQCCQEVRGLLKKKKQFKLALVRCSGMKVPEPKFQVPNAEEKDLWLAALNEAIKQSNYEQFDQVTVDEKNSLDHLTRNRVKINHTRRPPTRQHRREVATAVSDGMQRLELGAQDLIEDSTNEGNSKRKVVDHTNKNMPILVPKAKPRHLKVDDGLEVTVNQTKELGSKEGVEWESKQPAATEIEEQEGEEPASTEDKEQENDGELVTDEGLEDVLSETVSQSPEGGSEPELQAHVSKDDEEKKLSSKTNSVILLSKANLSRVKCSSLGDILSDSKPEGAKKEFKAYYADLKNTNVAKMEGEIALELKVTEKLLQQVSNSKVWSLGDGTRDEHHPQSEVAKDGQSTQSAAYFLNEAMAKWSEADRVLQELKGFKEVCKNSEAVTLEEKERLKNLLAVHRRSAP
ncbi:pleckstrin homology domain-containing family O member 2-like [Narcine bancroftii]|uniref:pleckstrin homology domain-containing family O member 2-like n=1 Tax=Narcine bancroftii TaxID=1343680 RepID=UPI003831AF9D